MKVRTIFPGVAAVAAVMTLAAGLAGCSASQKEPSVDIVKVRADLEVVARARILLGHQSVGRDILAGVDSLAKEAGVHVRIEQIDGLPADELPGLFHAAIGQNGDPDSKCEVFEHLLTRPERPAYDVAMMKLCYVDLGRGTPYEAASLLDRYSKVVGKLETQRPDVRLVHISLPLRADPPGKKTMLKRLLGRPTDEDADNALRNAYNDGLRQRFSGEPLFDLAEVESTRPDGSRSAFSTQGRTIYTLAREYTNDGGHLNPEARRRAAAEFLRTLASALQQPSQQEPLQQSS